MVTMIKRKVVFGGAPSAPEGDDDQKEIWPTCLQGGVRVGTERTRVTMIDKKPGPFKVVFGGAPSAPVG